MAVAASVANVKRGTAIKGDEPAVVADAPPVLVQRPVEPPPPENDFADAWRDLRADDAIQFDEVVLPQNEPAPPPDWLLNTLEWLGEVMAPIGRFLVAIWPVLQWMLIALAVGLVLLVLWRLFGPDGSGVRLRRHRVVEEWVPDQQAALALLEDADRLAAEGRYDEAAHLLLQRSVGQIAEARPDLVLPASTAREIATAPALPAPARNAFAIIAERVERSLFALRRLTADDWQVARKAYADFALAQQAIRA